MAETKTKTKTKDAEAQSPDKDAGQPALPAVPPKPWDDLKGKAKEEAREDFCHLLREAGFPLKVIAERAGYSDPSGARKAANRALKRYGSEDLPEFRLVLLGRLERLVQAVWGTALTGDLKAVEQVRKLIEQEAAMTGVNAPTRLEVYTLDAWAAEIDRLEAELAQLPAD